MPKSLQVLTLGCSKNTVDTEHILNQVKDEFQILPENHQGNCDYLLLNTCGFIGDAKEESIQAIMDAVEKKKRGEIDKLVVFGCLSQRYMSTLPDLIPEVDSWFGAREMDPIINYLTGRKAKYKLNTRYNTTPKLGYAYLKISEGCNRRCSYCAIPFIRGNHISVPIEDLVREAQDLANQGIKELILIAQDTTFYGLDLYRRRALADLLKALSAVEGIEWIRVHYSYPASFPEDVLDEIATNPKVCKYIDIPLQHVADKVLKNMRRQVDGAWTRALIQKMKDKVPGIVIRTTMIVGHPGEGKKEFEELLDFIKTAKFERLGAFKYSEEEGTYGANNFKDTLSDKVKQQRYDELMTLQGAISYDKNQARIGQIYKVMVDDFVDNRLICRSEFDSPEVDGEILVKYDINSFNGKKPEDLVANFITVKIVDADEYDLVGEIYNK